MFSSRELVAAEAELKSDAMDDVLEARYMRGIGALLLEKSIGNPAAETAVS